MARDLMPKSGIMMPHVVVTRDAAVVGVSTVDGFAGAIDLTDKYLQKTDASATYQTKAEGASKTYVLDSIQPIMEGALFKADPFVDNNVPFRSAGANGVESVDMIKVTPENSIKLGSYESSVQGVEIHSAGRVVVVDKNDSGVETKYPVYSKRFRPEIEDLPFAAIGSYVKDSKGRTIGVNRTGINSDIKQFTQKVTFQQPVTIADAVGDYDAVTLRQLRNSGGGIGATSVLSAKKKLMVSKEEEKPEIIAHRGFSKVFPENTMAAMQGALRLGANALECDLSVTSDGVVVLMHDETVDRTTNGTGKTVNLTSSYIRGLDAGSKSPNPSRYSGERVPLFSEVLKMCVARQVKLYAELAHLRSLSDVSIILNLIQEYGGESICVLCAADLSRLEEVRRLNKNIFLGALSYTAPTEEFFSSVTSLNNTYIQIPAWTASDVVLKRVHDSGLLCNLWTLDTSKAIQLATDKGFMQLMLDEPLYNTKF